MLEDYIVPLAFLNAGAVTIFWKMLMLQLDRPEWWDYGCIVGATVATAHYAVPVLQVFPPGPAAWRILTLWTGLAFAWLIYGTALEETQYLQTPERLAEVPQRVRGKQLEEMKS